METQTTKSQLNLPLRTRIVLSAIDLAIDPLLRDDGTVPRGLMNLVDFQIPALSIPVNGVKTHDVMVDPTRNLWFRVFVPTQYAEEDLPVMVYFHGGGYIALSPDVAVLDYVGRNFAKELHAVVVSVDYRLAPENRHPSQHDDGFDVLKFLDNEDNRSKWLPENANVSQCFIAGESAGGHLAHHVTLRASQFKFQQLKVRLSFIFFKPGAWLQLNRTMFNL